MAPCSGHSTCSRGALGLALAAQLAVGQAFTSPWWFWTGRSVLAAGRAAVAVVALGNQSRAPSGDIAPDRVSAPLVT